MSSFILEKKIDPIMYRNAHADGITMKHIKSLIAEQINAIGLSHYLPNRPIKIIVIKALYIKLLL